MFPATDFSEERPGSVIMVFSEKRRHEMILRDRINIDCTTDAVWHLIEDPVLMKTWNLRVREVVPVTLERRKEGCRYRIRYQLSTLESNFEAEIMEYHEPQRFVLHLSGGCLPKGSYIQESYDLSGGGSTSLLQTVELYGRGIGIMSKALFLLSHLLRPSRKGHLLRLKRVAEGGDAQH